MTLPKHQDPTFPERTARAPYNFVPLPEKALPTPDALLPQDRYHDGRHTGSIVCQLTTASPLYTRCGVTLDRFDQDKAKDQPDFFTHPTTHEPMIPGSSLRGMIRALIEIAGHGKMVDVTKRQLFFRTMDDSKVGTTYRDRMQDKVRGGIFHMQGDKYWIEPCIVGRVEREQLLTLLNLNDESDLLYDGRGPNMTPRWQYQYQPLWIVLHKEARADPYRFRVVEAIGKSKTASTPEPAVLVLTGNMQKKRKEFAFVLEGHQQIQVADEVIKRFHDDDQITAWQEKAFPSDQPRGARRRRNGALRDGEPIFYLCDEQGQVVFLGRAGHFRLPYRHSPFMMIPEGLKASDVIDLTEAMFGYVGLGTEPPARGGRVFVSDAVLDGSPEGIWHDEITPNVLSGPKPTAIQLYLTQKTPDRPKELRHYESDPELESTLRGHKLYWHKGDVALSSVQADPEQASRFPTQYTRIRPVKSGVRFGFTIWFENLSGVELGALLWVLDVAGNELYRLKLGMGKPLGLGSVQITHELQFTNRRRRYARLFDGQGAWETGLEPTDEAAYSRAQALQAFADFILEDPILNPQHTATRLEDLPRLRTLLTLLSWPGPDPAKTTYMTELRDDFAKRKVLPTPQRVVGEVMPQAGHPPMSGPSAARRVQPAGPPVTIGSTRPVPARGVGPTLPRPSPAPTVPPAGSTPRSTPITNAPQWIDAKVVAVTGSFVTVEVAGEQANIPLDQLPERGRDERERLHLYPVGSPLKVMILPRSKQGKLRATAKVSWSTP